MLDGTSTKYVERSPGVYIQHPEQTDVTGGIAGLPDRLTTDFAPGQSGTICIGFQNRTGAPITLRFDTSDFGASMDGSPVPVGLDDAEHGAGAWLTLPTNHTESLQHGDIIWMDVAVDIPADTAGGSAYAGVSAADGGEVTHTKGTQAQVSSAVVVQVFFDVPGDITEGGEIIDVRSPRVVWWDGFDLGKIPVLERVRSAGIAPIRWKWRNTGSVSDEPGGSVEITSTLGGREVTTLDVPKRLVMRDSARSFEATWSKDIPFVGRFRPTIVVTDARGRTHTQQLDPIWVIPSWWYLLALVLAIAIPVWLRRRSKRRYRELLARVDAAEARADDDDDSSSY